MTAMNFSQIIRLLLFALPLTAGLVYAAPDKRFDRGNAQYLTSKTASMHFARLKSTSHLTCARVLHRWYPGPSGPF